MLARVLSVLLSVCGGTVLLDDRVFNSYPPPDLSAFSFSRSARSHSFSMRSRSVAAATFYSAFYRSGGLAMSGFRDTSTSKAPALFSSSVGELLFEFEWLLMMLDTKALSG